MPRYESNDPKNQGYGFFPSSPSAVEGSNAEEVARAKQETIAQIENYKRLIEERKREKEEFEQILKANLSLKVKEKVSNKVRDLEAQVSYHQNELESVIDSCPSLQPYFRP